MNNELGKENTLKILAFYNLTALGPADNVHIAQANMFTDFHMRCPTRNTMVSNINSDNIGYFYHYNYIASFAKHVWYFQPECWNMYVCIPFYNRYVTKRNYQLCGIQMPLPFMCF